MRPPRLIVRAYLVRAAAVWLTTRLVVSVVFAFGGENPFTIPVTGLFWLVVFSTALTLFDVRRRHERILIGNLAISPAFIATLATIPAAAGETLLRVVTTVLTA
jgi:hypothetical protein